MNSFWRTILALAVMALALAAVGMAAANDGDNGSPPTTVPPDCAPGEVCECPYPGPEADGSYCDDDSDGDGYFDSEELSAGSDPNNPNSTPEAWWYGTCEDGSDNDLDAATDKDDDNCGDPCEWPEPLPGDPPQPMPFYICDEDTDGDGYFDSEEVSSGSDPNDANSTPEVWWYGTCEDGVRQRPRRFSRQGRRRLRGPVRRRAARSPAIHRNRWHPGSATRTRTVTATSIPKSRAPAPTRITPKSTPEVWWYGTCEDGSDNDLDGATDSDDDGCKDGCSWPVPVPGDGTEPMPPIFCDEDSDGDGYFDSEETGRRI